MSKSTISVFLLEDDQAHAEIIKRSLYNDSRFRIRETDSLKNFRVQIAMESPDIVLADLNLSDGKAWELIAYPPESLPYPVIVLTSFGDENIAVKAVRAGAMDYLSKSRQNFENLPHIIDRTLREWNHILERKRTEEILRTAELKFRTVADNTYDWEFWHSPTGEFIYNSPACRKVSGHDSIEFIDDPGLFRNIIIPADRSIWDAHREESLQELESVPIELRILHTDGTERWIEHVCNPVHDTAGAFIGTRGTNRDITSQKVSVKALLEGEKKYRILFESMRQGVFYQESNGRVIGVNLAALRIFGLSRDQFLGRTSYHSDWKVIREDGSVIKPRDHPSMVALRTGQPVYDAVAGVYNPERGSFVWVMINAMPEFHEGEKKPFQVVVTLHDITERKAAEDALTGSGELYRKILAASLDGYMLMDLDGNIKDANNSFGDRLGYSCTELLSMNVRELLILDSPDLAEAKIRKVIADKHDRFTVKVRTREGSVLDGEVSAFYLDLNGGQIVTFSHDITQRLRGLSAIKESEARYRTIVETANEGIWTLDKNLNTVFVNKRMADMLGYHQEEMIGKPAEAFLFDVDRDQYGSQMGIPDKDMSAIMERRFRRKDGTELWTLISGKTMKDTAGKFSGSFAMLTDISKRKHAETALQLSESRFRHISTAISDIAYSCHLINETCFEINWMMGAIEQITGYSKEEIMARKCWRFLVVREDLPEFDKYISGLKPGLSGHTELRIRNRNGEIVWVASHAECISPDIPKTGCYIYGALVNITERKLAEEKLRESETRYRGMFNATTVGFIEVRELKIVRVNDAFCKLSGYSKEQLIGENVNMLYAIGIEYHFPGKLKSEFFEKGFFISEHKILTRMGYLIDTLFSVSLLDREDPGNPCIISVIDISGQKLFEAELNKSKEELRKLTGHIILAREQEKKAIAREIHDDLGQKLAVLKWDLNWLVSRVRPSKAVTRKIEELNTMIRESISAIHRIMKELHPPELDELGLIEAIEWQARELMNRTGLQIKMNIDCTGVRFTSDIELSIFRVVQEALTNIIRHAGATVVLLNMKMNGESLLIDIHDNGKGIPHNVLASPDSYGLSGMRERVMSCNGTILINGINKKGTEIRIKIPLPENMNN
jgi:PAS domain S-box-containing protein